MEEEVRTCQLEKEGKEQCAGEYEGNGSHGSDDDGNFLFFSP